MEKWNDGVMDFKSQIARIAARHANFKLNFQSEI